MKKIYFVIPFLFIFLGFSSAFAQNSNLGKNSILKSWNQLKFNISKSINCNSVKNLKTTTLSGIYSIGFGINDDYQTLNQALGVLQISGVSAPVVFELSANYNPDIESYPIYFFSFQGNSSTNTLTVRPAANVNIVIEKSTTTQMSAVFAIVDAQNIIIDGSNNGTSSRNLTIRNTSQLDNCAAIALFTNITPGRDITIKNCVLKAYSKNITSAGIFSNKFTNITLQNNEISNSEIGIIFSEGSDVEVINNVIGSETEAEYLNYGIGFQNIANYVCSGNIVKNIYSDSNEGAYAISTYQGTGNNEISSNIVKNIYHTTNNVAQPIAILDENATSLKIINNQISDFASESYTDNYPTAIAILSPNMTSGIEICYNTISLTENNLYGTGNGDDFVFISGISIGAGSGIILKNNIISNTIGEISGSTKVTTGVAVLIANTVSPFAEVSNNVYFTEGDFDYNFLAFNYNGQLNHADWNTWTGDEFSFYENPLFNSNADLNLQPCSPSIAHAVPLVDVNEDITGCTRHQLYPTIGAYEYEMIQSSELQQTIEKSVQECFSWNNGNGCKRIIFMKEGDVLPENPIPQNGHTYLSDNIFQTGEQIGETGWFCIENGDLYGSSCIDNLPDWQIYTIMVCEYFGSPGNEVYLTEFANNNPILIYSSTNIKNIENYDLSLFPNPTSGKFTIKSSQNIENIEIKDLTGRVIQKIESKNISENEIDLSDFVNGIYFVKTYSEGKVFVSKIIKK